jgi:hypothetical protein
VLSDHPAILVRPLIKIFDRAFAQVREIVLKMLQVFRIKHPLLFRVWSARHDLSILAHSLFIRLVALQEFVWKIGGRLQKGMAEREGFEPPLEFPLNTLSKRAPSATRPSLHWCCTYEREAAALGGESRQY